MALRTILISGLLLTLPTLALAQSGTPEERAACRADVRRFCYKLKPDADSQAFLQCLQEHRARLTKRCRAVLESHGG